MRFAARRAFQGLDGDFFDLGIAHLAGCPWSRFVIEPFQPSFQKSRTPLADHAQRGAQFSRHGFIVQSLRTSQPHSRAPGPVTAGCEPDVSVIGAARVLLRSISLPVWVVRSASKTSSDVRRAAVIFSSLISGTGD